MFTRAYSSLPQFSHAFRRIFTHVCTCLPMCTLVYQCLLVFTYIDSCLPMFTRVYLCLHFSTYVYLCLLVFTYVYMFTILFIESGMIKGCGINNFPRQCPTWNHVSRRTSNGKPDDSSCASILDTQAPEKE